MTQLQIYVRHPTHPWKTTFADFCLQLITTSTTSSVMLWQQCELHAHSKPLWIPLRLCRLLVNVLNLFTISRRISPWVFSQHLPWLLCLLLYDKLLMALTRLSSLDSKSQTTIWYRYWCRWITSWTSWIRIRRCQSPFIHTWVLFSIRTARYYSLQSKCPTWRSRNVSKPWLLFRKTLGTLNF